jgi:hypothetical protein
MKSDYERALHAEMLAIRRIVAALDSLQPEVAARIVRYLVDRYGKEDK